VDAKRIEQQLTDRAGEITHLLGQHVPQTRQILRKLIPDEIVDGKRGPGRIVCTRIDDERGKGYSFLAQGSYSRLLGSGLAVVTNGGGGHPLPALFCPTLRVPLRLNREASGKIQG